MSEFGKGFTAALIGIALSIAAIVVIMRANGIYVRLAYQNMWVPSALSQGGFCSDDDVHWWKARTDGNGNATCYEADKP